MAINAKQVSPIQIILITYIVITTPALMLAYYTIKTIDDELAKHVEFSANGVVEIKPRITEKLVVMGDYLRDHEFPFSQIEKDSAHANIHQLDDWTENLRSERAAILYSWIALFSFGIVVYVALARRLHTVFGRLVTSINNLRDHKLNEEIEIENRSVLRDVSTSLESLRIQMSNDEKQQQKFLRHISHEIKTPLTSIKEGATLLDQQVMGEMNSEQQEVASILVRSSIELQNAIENLLDYNAAIGLRENTPRNRIRLSQLIEKALENNELAIKQKSLKIDLSADDCEALIDRRQITAVFDNLLSNAIKHSPTGDKIIIKVAKNGPEKCCFQIADNGPGIDKSDHEFIFDPFYIGARQSEATLKGTGLGLSIAKQYVDDHGGQIKLVDSPTGTTFSVCIPVG